jgi:hypothetical protein
MVETDGKMDMTRSKTIGHKKHNPSSKPSIKPVSSISNW